jgi:signal transduction histidine kinase
MPAAGPVAYRQAVREIRQRRYAELRARRGRPSQGWPSDGRSGDGRPSDGRSGDGWSGPGWHGRGWRHDGRRNRGPGLGLAILVGVIQVVSATRAADEQTAATALDALGYALLLIGPLALALRRWAPVPVFAVSAAAAAAYPLLGYPRTPLMFLAAAAALFAAVTAGHRYAAWVIAAVSYLAYVGLDPLLTALGWAGLHGPGLGQALVVVVVMVVLLFLAEAARVKREELAQLGRIRAEQARARAEQQRRQESEERLRIAQELHDVLGHHLSLINVQAGVGLHLMDSRPEQAREALAAIKTASAEALREVRSVLGVLRTDGAAPRSPAPGLERLTELTADAGFTVDTRVTGSARPLPAEVSRAAYRIVQEALTNVRRHAGPGATAAIDIEYADGALVLRVDDDGVGAPADLDDEAGNGVAGMRARATALGGSLSAGPGPDGGFRVAVRLPAAGGSA